MTSLAVSRSELAEMPVAGWMTLGVIRCTPDTPLQTAAELMVARRVHCVVVAAEADDGRFWGIVSDLDLVAAAGVRDLDGQSAGGSAATPALVVTPDETLERAAQLMTEHATTHLVVVDAGRPVGVISTLDVARALVHAAR
jgi:CBS domain-containing protein